MNEIDIENDYHQQLLELRNFEHIGEQLNEILKRGLSVPKSLHTNRLLFIGLNPSYSTKRNVAHQIIDYYEQPSNQVNPYKPYYNAIKELAAKVEMEWTHWDLLYVRETKQEFVKLFADPFTKQQVNLSIEIIKQSTPHIIVVNNAYATWLLKNSLNFIFDNSIGTYRFSPGNDSISEVPIFFCSMLSGQRAMDLGSKERLAWHIKFVHQSLINSQPST